MTTPITDEELSKARDELADDHVIEPNMFASYRSSFKSGFNAGARYQAEKMQGEIEELVGAANKYILSRKVVDKELDWDAFEAFEKALKKLKESK